jgi:hypothetical protein
MPSRRLNWDIELRFRQRQASGVPKSSLMLAASRDAGILSRLAIQPHTIRAKVTAAVELFLSPFQSDTFIPHLHPVQLVRP